MATLTTNKPLSIKQASIMLAQKLDQFETLPNLPNRQNHAYRIEIEIADLDLLSWLNNQDSVVKIFWEDREKKFMVAGIDCADLLNVKNREEDYEIISRIRKNLCSDFSNLEYFGGFCFNPGYSPKKEWKNFGLGRFILPLIEIRKTKFSTTLACNFLLNDNFVNTKKDLTKKLFALKDPQIISSLTLRAPSHQLNIPDEKVWKISARNIIRAINKNKYQKVVLARSVHLGFTKPVNSFELMSRLRQSASNCFCFIFQFQKDEIFLGTSPERLYKRNGENFETEAIAGTRPQSHKLNENSFVANDLLYSDKDKKEQNFVTEMIKNNLSQLSTSFYADPNPSLLNWSAGHHLITRFHGQLKNNVSDQQLLKKLHPTPAVAGTPTDCALKEIHKIENFDRGWYSGPVGYIGFDKSEFAVAIRSALLQNKDVHLYAGAGIIKESLPRAEWEETENKLVNFLASFDANQK